MAVTDRELWACAAEVIRQHGDTADLHAAQRADQMLECMDLDGHKTWLRILDRINDLQAPAPVGMVH